MELCSLHPFEESAVRAFVSSLNDPAVSAHSADGANLRLLQDARRALEQTKQGEDRGPYALSYALATDLALMQPSYAHPGICLTTWEARVDRGLGMLMRPPSRLLIEAGMDPVVARRLPIRLDLSRGMMGGAYVPARLMSDFQRLLHTHIERAVKRLIEAEWDGVAVLGMMIELVDYASQRGMAIYEAMDIISDRGEAPTIPGATVILADRKRLDKQLRAQLELAAKPPKKPGLFSRWSGRGRGAVDDSAGFES
jgi:hypothetical protein